MRTNAQRINTKAKKAAVGVVVVLQISLGLESVDRTFKLTDRDEISKEEAIKIAKRKYTSIVHAGGNIKIAKIEKYKPIKLGIKGVLQSLKMY